MPKKTKTGLRPPPPRPGPVPASTPDPVAQWVETQKKETAATQKKEETAAPRAPPPAAKEKIPDWETIREMLHGIGITWGTVLAARWKRSWEKQGGDSDPTEGAFLLIEFCDDRHEAFDIEAGGPDDPLPETPPPPPPLGLSPITTIHTEPTEPTPGALGFSQIHTVLAEEPATPPGVSPEKPPPPPTAIPAATPTPTGNRNKKRKGKMPASQDTYALKRQLSDKEAEKIASASPVNTDSAHNPAGSTPAPTQNPEPQTPAPKSPKPTPEPYPRRQTARSHPPTRPDNNTSRQGIVVHGIALRKDLGNVKRWLEASNKDIGKITGIRWLRKKTILVEEGKQTSSVVVYLETPTESGKVRLGGRWLRTSVYETDRGRK